MCGCFEACYLLHDLPFLPSLLASKSGKMGGIWRCACVYVEKEGKLRGLSQIDGRTMENEEMEMERQGPITPCFPDLLTFLRFIYLPMCPLKLLFGTTFCIAKKKRKKKGCGGLWIDFQGHVALPCFCPVSCNATGCSSSDIQLRQVWFGLVRLSLCACLRLLSYLEFN